MRPHKKAAFIAAGTMTLLVAACGSPTETDTDASQVSETATAEETPDEPVPVETEIATEPEPTRTREPGAWDDPEIVREAAEALFPDCQDLYVETLHGWGLVEDPSTAWNAGGRFEQSRTGMITVYGKVKVDGDDEPLPWQCSISDGADPGNWKILFVHHAEDSPYYGEVFE